MKAKAKLEREDARYMRLRRAGVKPVAIARRCGVCLKTVYNGIARERAREAAERRAAAVTIRGPRLTLDFGSSCKPLALLTCSDVHPRGPMPEGTRCCCAACHKSGVEGHPSLVVDVLPAPEPRPAPKPSTRKQKRAEKRQLVGAA